MTDDPEQGFAQLTLAACRTLIGEEFRRPHDAGPDVVLRLIAAESVRRDPTADTAGDRPFSLLFNGPLDPVLTQGMHDLEHPEHPLRGLFLVPVSRDDEGCQYEAIFS